MTKARFRRRKDDRPSEITAAAMDAFAEHGYDATPVASVAERAGVSKGLLYRYFNTKEELFKAVVRRFIVPKVDALQAAVNSTELGAEAFLRGPFLDFAKQIPRSRARFVLRLMIAEGYKHPDLTRWYWDHVASHGLAALQQLVARGVENGEFRPSALERFPQLLLSPVILSVIWTLVFQRHHKLDTDAFLEAHINLLLAAIRAGDKPPDTAS